MDVAERLLVWRATRTVRQAERDRRRRLERELACYSSAAERRELESILERHPDAVTKEVRSILAGQAARRTSPGCGMRPPAA